MSRHGTQTSSRNIGSAKAYANVWNGSRVIQASFKYTRGGQDVIGWQRSSATVNSSCTWSPGQTRSRAIADSLNPRAPKTVWRYSWATLPPQAC